MISLNFGIEFSSTILNRNMIRIYIIILLSIVLTACASTKKSFDRHDYDSAVSIVVDKLQKNKKIKDDEILLLEEAYYRALERDKEKVQQLKSSNRPEVWVDIFNIYTSMMKRQDAVARVTPIYLSNGKSIGFTSYDFNPAREEARMNVAEYHYTTAQYLLSTNLRSDARNAYNHLDCILFYFKDYKDTKNLLSIAKDKGTTHVLMTVDKNPHLFLPQDFEYELFNYNYQSTLSNWVALYTNSNERNHFDFAVRLILTDSYISPGTVKETFYNEEKEVEDGWQYVYDPRGNVMKDSIGNDIKVPKYTKLIARVTETQMHRSATLRGTIDFYDFTKKRVVRQEVAQGESVFNYYYAIYTGHKSALSNESLKKIQNRPAPFPSDADMIVLATNEIKQQFRNIFRANSRLFNND